MAKFRGGGSAGLRHSHLVNSAREEYELKVFCMPSAQSTIHHTTQSWGSPFTRERVGNAAVPLHNNKQCTFLSYFAEIISSSCYSHRLVNRKHLTYGTQTFWILQSLAPNEVLCLFKFKIRPDHSLLHSFIQLKKKKKERLKHFPGTWREQLDTSVSYKSSEQKESNA